MEGFKINEAVQDWIKTDLKLSEILVEIESKTDSAFEQAKIAFHRLSEEYKLQKFPDDDGHSAFSVYEQLGKLNFIREPQDDIRALVLMAIYSVKEDYDIYIDNVLKKIVNSNELSGFGYKGDSIEVIMVPIKRDESWFDKGCKYFTRVI